MAGSTDVETQWYENVEEGTFHEVIVGSDTEKRLRKEQFQSDPDDENSLEQRYKKVSRLPAASKQPGYVKSGASEAQAQTPASPVAPTVEDIPQTPTADTNNGPLVGEPGAQKQAETEVELGGAPIGGVKASATAAKGK